MARETTGKCKKCRREGAKLFLKGDRCYTPDCAFEKKGYAPGQHGIRFSKMSEYAIRLREKQKAKRIYGVLERQFQKYFGMAEQQKGATGENLLRLLERRLDNIVYRGGFGVSRSLARQLIRHGHLTLNGHNINIPSTLLKPGDVVKVKEKSREMKPIKESVERAKDRANVPGWITADFAEMSIALKEIPSREATGSALKEHLIVEFYSR